MAGMDDNTMASPAYCKNGCGFYGSPNTEELCSKCFRDLKKDGATTNLTPASATTCRAENSSPMSSVPPVPLNVGQPEMSENPSSASVSTPSDPIPISNTDNKSRLIGAESIDTSLPSSIGQSTPGSAPSDGEGTPRKKTRCGICNKKLGLTGFSCRCGGMYCSLHRYIDAHQCSFDYKTDGKNAIRKANPKVDGEKVAKI